MSTYFSLWQDKESKQNESRISLFKNLPTNELFRKRTNRIPYWKTPAYQLRKYRFKQLSPQDKEELLNRMEIQELNYEGPTIMEYEEPTVLDIKETEMNEYEEPPRRYFKRKKEEPEEVTTLPTSSKSARKKKKIEEHEYFKKYVPKKPKIRKKKKY
jgi:hypothetical protein